MNSNNKDMIVSIVKEKVKKIIAEYEDRRVPIGISNRHVHLSKEDLEHLFGKEYKLTKFKDLAQPGQFASKETLKIVGPKGSFDKVRILGPVRDTTQVEVSLTDGFKIGLNVPIRESGNINNTPGILLEGPKGRVIKDIGVIVALRHIHMTPEIANQYGLKDKEMVDVETEGIRRMIFGNVLVRVSNQYKLEMHIDMDEANSGGLKNGDTARILKNKE